MRRQLCLLTACVATMALLAAEASAVVLYSDTFSRTTGSGDVNDNPDGVNNGSSSWDSADNGLGGSAIVPWTTGPSRGGGRNQVTDGDWGTLWQGVARNTIDASASSPNGFTVGFDFDRLYGNSFYTAPASGNGFIALGVGFDATNPDNEFSVTTDSEFAILFQQSVGTYTGNTQVFANGTQIGLLGGVGPEGALDYGDPAAVHSVLLTFTPVVSGAYSSTDTINVDVLVNGSSTFSTTVMGGANFGHLAFGANAAGGMGGNVPRGVDNLVVSSIPEPTTFGIAGIMAILGLVVRKRS